MRRISILALSFCAAASLGFLSVAAEAGDYYDGGYRHRDSGNVRYSAQCCYKKVVRVVRSVSYVRVDAGRSYHDDRSYRRGYYPAAPRHYSGNYDAPRRSVSSHDAPRRYVDNTYYGNGYRSYAQTCTWRRDRFDDGEGGWVWGERRRVYH